MKEINTKEERNKHERRQIALEKIFFFIKLAFVTTRGGKKLREKNKTQRRKWGENLVMNEGGYKFVSKGKSEPFN